MIAGEEDMKNMSKEKWSTREEKTEKSSQVKYTWIDKAIRVNVYLQFILNKKN